MYAVHVFLLATTWHAANIDDERILQLQFLRAERQTALHPSPVTNTFSRAGKVGVTWGFSDKPMTE